MTLYEAIQEAVREADYLWRVDKVRGVAEFMRFRLGLTYEGSLRCVEKAGIDRKQWEELLYEADRSE